MSNNTYRYSKEIRDVIGTSTTVGDSGVPRTRSRVDSNTVVNASWKAQSIGPTGTILANQGGPVPYSFCPHSEVMTDYVTKGYKRLISQGARFNKPMSKTEVFAAVEPFSGQVWRNDQKVGGAYDYCDVTLWSFMPSDFSDMTFPQDNSSYLLSVDQTDAVNAAYAEAHQQLVMLKVDLVEWRKTAGMLKGLLGDAKSILGRIQVVARSSRGARRSTVKLASTRSLADISRNTRAKPGQGSKMLATKPLYKQPTAMGETKFLPIKRTKYTIHKGEFRKVKAKGKVNATTQAQAIRENAFSRAKRAERDRLATKAVKADVAKTLEGQLILNYGLLPLMSSIGGTIKALSQERKAVRQSYRGFRSGSCTTVSTQAKPLFGPAATCTIEKVDTWQVRAVVATLYSPPFLSKMGLLKTQAVSDIWELTHFSMLWDRFQNVSTYLKAIVPIQGQLAMESSMTTELRTEITYRFSQPMEKINYTDYVRTNFAVTCSYTIVTIKTIRSVNVSPAFPGWNGQFKSANTLFNAVAIASQLLGTGLKNIRY